MNFLYTITWLDSDQEETARLFYGKLRASIAGGARFPFDGPYEVALARASSTPDATPPPADWAVVFLVMRFAANELGASDQSLPQLENWFSQCIPGGIPAGARIMPGQATHLRLDSELSPDYKVVGSFGTFVGEPEVAPPQAAGESKPAEAAEAAKAPLSPEAEALKALVGLPLTDQLKAALNRQALLAPPPPPSRVETYPPPAAPAKPAFSPTARTCLGLALLISGVLLVPVSLVLGALMALGQFTPPDPSSTIPPTSTTDFIFLLACCPLPILVLGAGLILLGVFLPRWMKNIG
jgi:hypothetical protein